MNEWDRIVETYRGEADGLLEEIERVLLDLESGPDDPERVGRLFRAFHTLKGGGAMFGFEAVSEFVHEVETALDAVRRGEIPLTPRMVDLLLAARDRTKAIFDETTGRQPPDPDASDRILTALKAAADPDAAGEPPAPPPEPEAATEPAVSEAPSSVEAGPPLSGADKAIPDQPPPRMETDVRVDPRKLDALMDLAGELVVTQANISNRVWSAETELEDALGDRRAEGAVVRDLIPPVESLERLTAAIRDLSLGLRMRPVGDLFGRFRRLVRDLSARMDKEIGLDLTGADTELDRAVLEQLHDPLIHLIRNSADHGIQTPDDRLRAGKPRRGTIRLAAVARGPVVEITIDDDGKGLSPEAVRARALEMGLIGPGDQRSGERLLTLVFHPGFSTARRLTEVSGRGVGMDVVKRRIDALGGTIRMTNRPGRGLQIHLTIPLTLALFDGLEVTVGNERYILPLAHVETCAEIDGRVAFGGGAVAHRGRMLPCVRLRERFGVPGHPEIVHLVVLRMGADRVGIVVDQVVGNIQTVVKPLKKRWGRWKGVSGAAIMGDGGVALILDIRELVRGSGD